MGYYSPAAGLASPSVMGYYSPAAGLASPSLMSIRGNCSKAGQSIFDGDYGKLANPFVMGHFQPAGRLASPRRVHYLINIERLPNPYRVILNYDWPVHIQ
jgi:hypothetical protein